MAQYIYQFGPGERGELATHPEAWTDEDRRVGAEHFQYLAAAAREGTLILAGRSPDGVGPAIVVFEAAGDEEARRFMEHDPFVARSLFTAELHPFRASLVRGEVD